uniref:Uncharacterized protein n=1 Tax=Myotis myotis TaxID=51298 RepID=A0A7J7VYY9_MYOMY|nr:hypothetical protein mMyoMyo1_012342 [Myotis myotis]
MAHTSLYSCLNVLTVKREYTEDDAGLRNLNAFLALNQALTPTPSSAPTSIGPPSPAYTSTSLNLGLTPFLRPTTLWPSCVPRRSALMLIAFFGCPLLCGWALGVPALSAGMHLPLMLAVGLYPVP